MEVKPSFWQDLIKRKSFWVSLAITCAILLISIAIWIVHDILENQRIDATAITFTDNPTVAFGASAKVSDFAHPSEGTLLEDYVINTEQLGSVEITFNYTNLKHKRRTKSFTLNIIDQTAPKIYGSSLYTINQGYQGNLTNLILSGDDLDDSPRREITGTYDINTVGDYKLEYIVTDASGNQAKHPFTLRVVTPSNTAYDPIDLPKLPIADVIRQHKTNRTQIGIDVSQWQGEIDWSAVKSADVEFAIIRIGYQAGYGGEYIIDPYFETNLTGATKVGLPVGVYFYSYADSITEAQHQAEWVRDTLAGRSIPLGVAFDWEDWGNFNQAGMSFYTINRVANTFLDTLSASGYQGLLYGSKVYLERIWQPAKYPVWLAQYYDRATYAGDYTIWQMSSSGQVPGIIGDVDLDIRYLAD